ncbi:MAG: long-chain fatty acid--CoA ligase [Gammaproteobacteria bacterium]|nr:long-chain fatty acid--CoA ligase [Gammaproteobacteria bacterium]NNF48868.1 long-chain fatty acid--CoA ligase [Woeseiaceae bacterium]NNL64002.1 long-chain fatty acid--CoA ligase [Woeseiaceae bacterium]
MKQLSHYVTDWLDKRARLTPERVALIDYASGAETTFAAWNERVNRTANYLRTLGVGKGDLVAVYAMNRLEYLDLFWAAPKIGAILQNLNWRLTVHELQGIVESGAPKVLIYSEDWRAQVEELKGSVTTVEHVVAMTNPGPGELDIAEREAMATELTDIPQLELDHPWGVYYTGGTTGLPKGAVVTHGNVTWNSVNTITSWGIHGRHKAALQLPFFHIGGPMIFMVPLVHAGGTTILCSGFDPDETFDLVENSGITHYVAVPTMFQMLQEHARWDEADFSKLELVISGGAPCPLPVMQKFWDRGVDFKMGYGLTEASGNNFWLPPELVKEKIGSVGYPIFHIDMKTIREDGTACADGEEGELLIRGPHIMAGYWKNPEATADTIRDGWLHTGDVAVRDADGCYSILGRSKEMFISGGENVYPAEIESVLTAHPSVLEAAVVGVPHETWGEVGRAFLVVDKAYDEADLKAFLDERLARYKLPRSIVLLDELPLTAIGKLDKKLLEQYEDTK